MDREGLVALLQRACAKREYCSGQIRRKIEKICFDGKLEGGRVLSADEISEILQVLRDGKWVDDGRFACLYVRDKARFNKWGRTKIAMNLKMLGVGEDIVKEAIMQNMELFCADDLLKLMQKKYDSYKSDLPKESKREKVVRFALQRGYQWSEIISVLDRLG